MQPIQLYGKDEINFTSLGFGFLTDPVSCSVTEELNGEFELEMEYPMGGALYSELKEERILFCKPNPYDNPQPFRIYEIERPVEDNLTINARHIHFDLANVAMKTRTTGTTINTLAAAIAELDDHMLESQPMKNTWNFSIPSGQTFTEVEYAGLGTPHQASELIYDDNDDSLVNVYDAELAFDKFNCYFYKKRGENRGVNIEYAKNITSLTHTVNADNCYTGFMPYYSQDTQETSSSTKKEYTKAYIVPNTTAYKYGWLSLKSTKSERAANKIDAYNDSMLYLICKDSSDDTSVDTYVNQLVYQTNQIDRDVYWKKLTKAEFDALQNPTLITFDSDGNYHRNASIASQQYNATLISGVTAYSRDWFSTILYQQTSDIQKITILPVGSTEIAGIVLSANEYIFVDQSGNQAAEDKQYLGYYYTPVLDSTGMPDTTSTGFNQWTDTSSEGYVMRAAYAMENAYSSGSLIDEPTLANGVLSPDGVAAWTSENPPSTSYYYIVVNQYTMNDTSVTNEYFQRCYYYKSSLSKFMYNSGLLKTIISKIKSYVSSTTSTVHKMFLRINSTTEEPEPVYFTETGHSSSDIYQKIKMVDVSSEFDEAPISNADFTTKIADWVTEHKKDYMYNEIEIDTSFILLSDDPLYANLFEVEHIELGDTVTIVHSKYDIREEQRVVSATYDVINNKYEEITLQKEEEDDE